MPHRLADKSEIRRRLNADREWSLYALADLDDGLFDQCEWWALGDALALVFRGIAIRPIFVLGDADATEKLLCALPENAGYLNVQQHQLEAAERVFRFGNRHRMTRMFLGAFTPCTGATESLNGDDAPEIEGLYATGDGGGIGFARFQLKTGFFRGIRKNGMLVAVAGVQVVSPNEGVAAVGNVFTHPDWRGQGMARTVTSAVVEALRKAEIGTIGLNVDPTNIPAIRAYERLGFRTRLQYYEGVAERQVC